MNRLLTYSLTLGVWITIVTALAVTPVYAQDTQPGLTNTTCPVTEGEAVDPTKYVDYEGQRIYFCCDRCLSKFKANPARYADGLARVMPVSAAATTDLLASDAAPQAGHGDDHGQDPASVPGDDAPQSKTIQPHDPTTGAAPRLDAGAAALLDDGHDAGGGHENADTDADNDADGAHDHSAHDQGDSHEEADADADGDADGDHDHSAHGDKAEKSFLSHLIGWLGKFHPPTTHFPIGLLTAAAMAEFLFIKTKRTLFDNAAQFCVFLGAAGALGAVTLGWFYGGFRLVDNSWIMTTHRWMGTSVAVLSLVVAALSIASHRAGGEKRLPAYRAVLFLTVGLVSVTGFFGGALVYGLNHYAW